MGEFQVIVNNEFVDGGQPVIHARNRSFAYGDGLFESIRVIKGQVLWVQSHYDRISEGLKALEIDKPEFFTKDWLCERLDKLLSINQVTSGGKVKVTVYRDSPGTYWPDQNHAGVLIEAYPLEKEEFELNPEGLSIEIYPEMTKQVNKLANYKTTNSLFYVMAARYCQRKGLGDCLLTNDNRNIIEATSSNLFIVSNKVLYTPAVTDGCVAGTMRMQLINLALANGIKVYESSLTPQNLLVADEVFLTNAIQGIRWAGKFREKRYFNDMSRSLTDLLNEKALSLE